MKATKSSLRSIDTYIAQFPRETQAILQQIRKAIRAAAPAAEEAISYGIPTFKLHGNLVHFAAWKNHVGFYPASSGITAFAADLSRYEVSRGTVQFPLDEKIPYGLIKRITTFRVRENKAKAAAKAKR